MPIELYHADRGGVGRSSRLRKSRRRGVATLWLILMLPVLLILLCLVVEITNLWLARLELEDALESSALAAVQEWGEAGGGGTLVPRNVGIEFASENTVRSNPVVLTSNYDAGSLPNENAATTGPTADLVFGAITQTSPTVIFDANAAPGCFLGPVALDATSLLAPAPSNDNFWGVNFKSTAGQPAGLEILQIVINLRAAPGSDQNAFFQGTPVLSDNSPNAVPSQNDVAGITAADLTFTLTPLANPNPHILTIDFDPGSFVPGERLRFGAELRNLNPPGTPPNAGDAVGVGNVSGTITFAIGGVPQPPVSFQYINTLVPVVLGPAPYVIPAPPGPVTNNGQSFVEVKADSGREFAVRAQKTITVAPVCGSLMGAIFGPFSVQADTVAEYDCDTKVPRIIRVDQFIPPP